jgi:Protein of unknown function (DUF433)
MTDIPPMRNSHQHCVSNPNDLRCPSRKTAARGAHSAPAVSVVLDCLGDGMSAEQIIDQYPLLSTEAIRAAAATQLIGLVTTRATMAGAATEQ